MIPHHTLLRDGEFIVCFWPFKKKTFSFSLRLLFTTPYSRTQWVLAKFVAASLYTILLLIWLAFLALFLSMWIFGTDDLFLMKSNYVVLIQEQDVFWRYLGAFVFASFSLSSLYFCCKNVSLCISSFIFSSLLSSLLCYS
jgi:ABC-type Na+ efflux pump permease subunit